MPRTTLCVGRNTATTLTTLGSTVRNHTCTWHAHSYVFPQNITYSVPGIFMQLPFIITVPPHSPNHAKQPSRLQHHTSFQSKKNHLCVIYALWQPVACQTEEPWPCIISPTTFRQFHLQQLASLNKKPSSKCFLNFTINKKQSKITPIPFHPHQSRKVHKFSFTKDFTQL